jgi:hypothetical protein
VLDDEVVMADSPALLRVAVDLAIADDHDGQDAEAARESGPEAVPTARLVERARPPEDVMEERSRNRASATAFRHALKANLAPPTSRTDTNS